jgi:hypothetical protein
MTPRVERQHVSEAIETTEAFVEYASEASTAEGAAQWALAAKNMAATVHPLIGARVTQARGGI